MGSLIPIIFSIIYLYSHGAALSCDDENEFARFYLNNNQDDFVVDSPAPFEQENLIRNQRFLKKKLCKGGHNFGHYTGHQGHYQYGHYPGYSSDYNNNFCGRYHHHKNLLHLLNRKYVRKLRPILRHSSRGYRPSPCGHFNAYQGHMNGYRSSPLVSRPYSSNYSPWIPRRQNYRNNNNYLYSYKPMHSGNVRNQASLPSSYYANSGYRSSPLPNSIPQQSDNYSGITTKSNVNSTKMLNSFPYGNQSQVNSDNRNTNGEMPTRNELHKTPMLNENKNLDENTAARVQTVPYVPQIPIVLTIQTAGAPTTYNRPSPVHHQGCSCNGNIQTGHPPLGYTSTVSGTNNLIQQHYNNGVMSPQNIQHSPNNPQIPSYYGNHQQNNYRRPSEEKNLANNWWWSSYPTESTQRLMYPSVPSSISTGSFYNSVPSSAVLGTQPLNVYQSQSHNSETSAQIQCPVVSPSIQNLHPFRPIRSTFYYNPRDLGNSLTQFTSELNKQHNNLLLIKKNDTNKTYFTLSNANNTATNNSAPSNITTSVDFNKEKIKNSTEIPPQIVQETSVTPLTEKIQQLSSSRSSTTEITPEEEPNEKRNSSPEEQLDEMRNSSDNSKIHSTEKIFVETSTNDKSVTTKAQED